MDNILKELNELSESLEACQEAYSIIYDSEITKDYWESVHEKVNNIINQVKELHA